MILPLCQAPLKLSSNLQQSRTPTQLKRFSIQRGKHQIKVFSQTLRLQTAPRLAYPSPTYPCRPIGRTKIPGLTQYLRSKNGQGHRIHWMPTLYVGDMVMRWLDL